MGGFFVFDPETKVGFTVSDKEIKDAGGLVLHLVGAYAIYSFVLFILVFLLLAPLVTVFALEYFVATFVKSNILFVVGCGVLLLCSRLFIGRLSQNIVIRIISFLYFFVFLLYVLLDYLQLDIGVYTLFGLFREHLPESSFAQLIPAEILDTRLAESWFYRMFQFVTGKFIDFIQWSGSKLLAIDHSAFQATLTDIDVLLVLKTLLLDVAIGSFTLITILAGGLLLIALLAVVILLPYCAAFYATITINKGIYIFRSLPTLRSALPSEEAKIDPIFQNALRKSTIKSEAAQKEAAQLYLQAAQAGNPYAQHCYAQCLESGSGVFPDQKEAFKWYRKAARQGLCNSMFMTALYYACGYGTYTDRTLARAWLVKSLHNTAFRDFVKASPLLTQTLSALTKKCRFTKYV